MSVRRYQRQREPRRLGGMGQVSHIESTHEKRPEDRMVRDQEGRSRKVGRQVYSIK